MTYLRCFYGLLILVQNASKFTICENERISSKMENVRGTYILSNVRDIVLVVYLNNYMY